MRLYPEKLAGALGKGLAPIYLMCGEEPLQREESADAVRRAAREQGYHGRSVHHIDNAQFDWSAVLGDAGSLSLFAERKILELRLNAAPGKAGGTALRQLAEQADPDTLVLITAGRIERASLSSAWYKAIDRHGVIVTSWPISGRRLLGWIRQRLEQAGVKADREAVELIAARVEGNLLAAKQEIDRLALLAGGGRLDGASAAQLVADSARYNEFELADRSLAGRRTEALRILDSLRAEGIAAPRVLWALARELRQLLSLHESGGGERAFAELRIPERRRGLYSAALQRQNGDALAGLLQQAAAVDRCIKGLAADDPWQALARLLMAMTAGGPPERQPGIR
jgi:DNA polymerase-3 subunit delta